MREPAFTPGPWKFVPWHIAEAPSQVIAPEGWLICETSSDANARLIAAAPALYEALRDCHMRLQTARDIGNAADDAALAKGSAALSLALGEPPNA